MKKKKNPEKVTDTLSLVRWVLNPLCAVRLFQQLDYCPVIPLLLSSLCYGSDFRLTCLSNIEIRVVLFLVLFLDSGRVGSRARRQIHTSRLFSLFASFLPFPGYTLLIHIKVEYCHRLQEGKSCQCTVSAGDMLIMLWLWKCTRLCKQEIIRQD